MHINVIVSVWSYLQTPAQSVSDSHSSQSVTVIPVSQSVTRFIYFVFQSSNKFLCSRLRMEVDVIFIWSSPNGARNHYFNIVGDLVHGCGVFLYVGQFPRLSSHYIGPVVFYQAPVDHSVSMFFLCCDFQFGNSVTVYKSHRSSCSQSVTVMAVSQ